MTREIKFRAWDGKRITTNGIMFNNSTGSINVPLGSILMQYTGLKDKNGKDIYEGDVLAYENISKFKKVLQNHFVIKWQYYGNGMVGWTQFSPIEKFVVVGNIYENPELLNP